MIYLKKANFEDAEKEYEAITSIPENENGFMNGFYAIAKDDFVNFGLQKMINSSEGRGLKEGHVPQTYFFVWDDDKIVGLFKIRHYLNDALRCGAGHIGYAILKEYRGAGYATEGLKAATEICKSLIKEDEIYMSSYKSNPASLRVQMKCGAYLSGENDDHYFTRIKLNRD